MKRAVIYARYSDEKQTEQSIEGQLRICNEYASVNRYTVIETYIDRAMSGKVHDRPAFLKMIEDSKSKIFDAVIVYQLDRFARNSYDSAIYEYALNKNGAILASAKENISDDPSGRLLKQVLIGLNEYYSAELAIKVDRGMRLTAEKLKHNGGPIPFGYALDQDNRYIPDPKSARYVQEIFERYAYGEKHSTIVAWLNANLVKTRTGRAFGRASLFWLLRNERYKGTYIWNEYRVENAFEALVSSDLFDRVQEKLKQNKKANARGRKTDFKLTTRAMCGICGANVIGETGTSSSGRIYLYYMCYNSSTKRKTFCDAKRISKDKLEELIYLKTLELVQDKSFINYAAKEANRVFAAEDNSLELDALKAEVKEVVKKRNNLLKAIEDGIISQSINDRINQLDLQISDLEIRISRAAIVKEKFCFDENVFRYFIERLLDKNCDDRDGHMKNIFNRFIRKVIVYRDYVEVLYNYADEIKKELPKTLVLESSGLNKLVIHPWLEHGTP